MNPSPLIPVEGEIARPRFMPLDGIPFGREWTLRRSSDAHADGTFVARIVTSCIDVAFPHRACSWLPLRPPASVPALPASRSAPADGSKRTLLAACWSVGALGIIGWLVATHAPESGTDASLRFVQSGTVTAQRPAQPVVTHAATPAPRPDTASHTPATPIAVAARPSPPIVVAPQPVAATPPAPIRHAQRLATTPQPHTTGRHAMPQMQYTAATTAPAAIRVAAPVRPTPQLERAVQPLPAASALDTLDDPHTLIAMAHALRAEQPAAAPSAPPPAGFDWTSRLSHRRLTDTPDAFTR